MAAKTSNRWILGLMLVLSISAIIAATTPVALTTDTTINSISKENGLPGSSDWRLAKPSRLGHAIAGYASATSVDRGGQLKLFVTTEPVSDYTIQLYRMGWYGGAGARMVLETAALAGVQQPDCPEDSVRHTVACNWRASYSLTVGVNWQSGIYLAKLMRVDGYEGYVIFALRDDRSHSPLLFQTSVNTYQAYNTWGGPSLYGRDDDKNSDPARRAYAVSFDRPYARGFGAGDFFFWEYPMLQWLERNAYDVTYQTDIDTDHLAAAAIIRQHKALLVVGHDEYWTAGMRDNIKAAIDYGVSVGFFGANIGYSQVRLEGGSLGSDRVIVCYKDKALDPLAKVQPGLTTVKWRQAPVSRPEDELIGEQYGGWLGSPYPGMVVQHTDTYPYFRTGLHDGDVLPGLIGYEYDTVQQDTSTPRNIELLGASPVTNNDGTRGMADVTLYQSISGAQVFAAGTLAWSWGLADEEIRAGDNEWTLHHIASAAIQRITENLISKMTQQKSIFALEQ